MFKKINKSILIALIAIITGAGFYFYSERPSLEIEFFNVKGMTCESCESTIRVSLKKVKGIKDVNPNFKSSTVVITYDTKKVTRDQIIEAIREAGYEVPVKKDQLKVNQVRMRVFHQ